MGRWGPTAFEDDSALDYLAGFMDRVVALYEEVLADRKVGSSGGWDAVAQALATPEGFRKDPQRGLGGQSPSEA